MSVISRRIATAAFAGAVALGLAAAPAGAKTMIKLGHPLTEKSGLQQWAEFFKAGIEARDGVDFEVKIYPASQLGTIPRMIEGAQLGTIELVTIPPGFFTGIDQRYSILAAPAVFDNIAHGHRVVHDPEFKEMFWHIGDDKGLKMVSMSCDAPSDYATVQPIRKIEDFKGRKLRVFGSKFEIETLRRLGATGVPMPLSEVIPAIQRKVIDGNKAAITVFVPFGYQSVAKYVLRAKESFICLNRMVSKKWFDGLPENQQTAIMEEAAEADDKVLEFNQQLVANMYKAWVKGGGELVEFEPAEQKELERRLEGVGRAVLEGQPEVLKAYNVMKRVADRLRGN